MCSAMKKVTTVLLLLSFNSNYASVQGSDFEDLADEVLEDIYNICKEIPLVIREITGGPVTSENVKYYLYDSSYPDVSTIIYASNASVLSTSAPIVVLVHGWTDDYLSEWLTESKNAFLRRNNQYLVIVVDWSVYAKLNYFSAQCDCKEVGFLIGEFIATLNTNYNIPLSNILIVGHSLGAQVSGFVGKKVFQLLNQRLPRIVALDPAGPLFEAKPKAERLHSSDAQVVEVIHTNGGIFGFLTECGTIDFYPNGGSLQPGCFNVSLDTISALTGAVRCDHSRSWKLFNEAVRTDTPIFLSRKCSTYLTWKFSPHLCDNSTEWMGSLETANTGNYFLDTNNGSPYSRSEL